MNLERLRRIAFDTGDIQAGFRLYEHAVRNGRVHLEMEVLPAALTTYARAGNVVSWIRALRRPFPVFWEHLLAVRFLKWGKREGSLMRYLTLQVAHRNNEIFEWTFPELISKELALAFHTSHWLEEEYFPKAELRQFIDSQVWRWREKRNLKRGLKRARAAGLICVDEETHCWRLDGHKLLTDRFPNLFSESFRPEGAEWAWNTCGLCKGTGLLLCKGPGFCKLCRGAKLLKPWEASISPFASVLGGTLDHELRAEIIPGPDIEAALKRDSAVTELIQSTKSNGFYAWSLWETVRKVIEIHYPNAHARHRIGAIIIGLFVLVQAGYREEALGRVQQLLAMDRLDMPAYLRRYALYLRAELT